ncbi:MAG: histone deacetylase family protein [Woeseia sp.]
MLTVYSEDHRLHDGLLEEAGDGYAPSFECPARANNVAAEIVSRKLGDIIPPSAYDDDKLTSLHDADYVEFLKVAWDEWVVAGETGTNAKPFAFVGAGMRHADSRNIFGKLGRYSFGTDAPLVAGSWQAIRRSAETALTGAGLILEGDRFAFSACRPPGHHATAALCGGYCYLNNTALAAQSLIDGGLDHVAIVDVDYHHGNGTQAIFYERSDVLTISLHADPSFEYPYFLGFSDERGSGNGAGFNRNYPLPFGTDWAEYSEALDDALHDVREFSPAALVVALGLDTFAGDPTTYFEILAEDYFTMGERLGSLNLPTLVVLEGGYAVDDIGINAVNFLEGVERAS